MSLVLPRKPTVMRFRIKIHTLNFKVIAMGHAVGFFTNSLQYQDANIVNFILAFSLERNWTNKV